MWSEWNNCLINHQTRTRNGISEKRDCTTQIESTSLGKYRFATITDMSASMIHLNLDYNSRPRFSTKRQVFAINADGHICLTFMKGDCLATTRSCLFDAPIAEYPLVKHRHDSDNKARFVWRDSISGGYNDTRFTYNNIDYKITYYDEQDWHIHLKPSSLERTVYEVGYMKRCSDELHGQYLQFSVDGQDTAESVAEVE